MKGGLNRLGKIKLYTNWTGFQLLQAGQSLLGWNKRMSSWDIEIELPTSAVRIAEKYTDSSDLPIKIDFEILEKSKW